eukprot:TRINITY_DN12714_c0_g1_i1.p1 TRINITY_DN12714_c0_g1~~TRINITY_DN12714_c0_g1_i1.p1  ORF type:complete len:409 (+),score=69.03 TRINITY_DN12714_c0_g1_i1:110-1336(+)
MPDDTYCVDGVGYPHLIVLTVPYNMDFAQAIGVFFSMMPLCLMIFYFFGWVFTRKFIFLILLATGGLASAINQFALKTIEKQYRPTESCLEEDDGFPSGHSVNSTSVLTFLVLTLLFDRYRYSWRKKIILIFIFVVILGLNGPSRYLVRDHSWLQVGVGMAGGVVWGTIVWVIFRFIFQRYILEKLMCTKFARFLRLVNDLDPDFKHSKYDGKKYQEQLDTNKESVKHNTFENPTFEENKKNCRRAIVVHLISALVQIVLGIIAIIYPIFQSGIPLDCPRADIGLLISLGCFTVSIGLAQIFIAYLLYQKSKDEKWWPFALKSAMVFLSVLFIIACLYTFLAGHAVDKQRCPYQGTSRTIAYVISWGVIQFTMLIYWLAAFFLLKLNRLYADQTITYPANGSRMPTAI